MEHPANATTSAQTNEPHTGHTDNTTPHSVDRPLITPKEFIRAIYMLSGAAIVVLSLAIWFMMSLA
jgi:hypothetical protein